MEKYYYDILNKHTPFKADMGGFPYKYFKKYIPDNLYVSSTFRVDKTEEDGFAYTERTNRLRLTIFRLMIRRIFLIR